MPEEPNPHFQSSLSANKAATTSFFVADSPQIAPPVSVLPQGAWWGGPRALIQAHQQESRGRHMHAHTLRAVLGVQSCPAESAKHL